MRWPTRQDWSFALVTFAAATLALYIAFAADLQRPYWAAGTVYIVSQRNAGALNAKALWRLIGTLCGAAFAVAAVPNLVDSPPLLIVALAGWAGVCLAGSLLDGSLRGYAFMLAGYTAAIIGFPSVDTPMAIFDTAIARVEEISLGIVCCHVLHAIFLVKNVGPALREQMDGWLTDLAALASASLTSYVRVSHAERRRLAMRVGAIDQLFDQARYERDDPQILRTMYALRRQVRRTGLMMTSSVSRLANLRQYEPEVFEQIAPLVDDIRAWLSASIPSVQRQQYPDPRPLLDKLDAAAAVPVNGSWGSLVRAGLLIRLREFVTLWCDCIDIAQGTRVVQESPPVWSRPRGHVDPLLVVLSCLAVAISLIGVCTFWRVTAWPAGSTAAIMAVVAGSIFAHMDDPAPAINSFLLGNALAVTVAGVFLFGVFPGIDGFPALIASLGVFLIPAAAVVSNPFFTPWLTPALLNALPTMSLQETYSADFATFLNNGISTVIGITFTLIVTLIMRSMNAPQRIARLIRADRRDMGNIASGKSVIQYDDLLDKMLDRFEAVAIRLGDELSSDLKGLEFGNLRASLNMLQLHRGMNRFGAATRSVIGRTLLAIASYAKGDLTPEEAVNALDEAVWSFPAFSSPEVREAAIDLVGIRLALFPDVAPPGNRRVVN
ncbi:FUSC family protein [Paraburkholderia antibiotica]|uniref:FUSC family protein n=1 Tax=Paraburkholderia antibiotica TaxID=2728839 RepID=A0A7Y0A0Q4_9BURK|nr:FUSC family protein [Paraburkholderia antibiotica]NML34373.1 FUSC family protein [Paraburkholderia antibiotica]